MIQLRPWKGARICDPAGVGDMGHLTRVSRRRPRATGWDPAGVQVSYNEDMRKRKWWFVGLALALLAGLVALCLLPPSPPYAFLKGSTLSDMGIVHGLSGSDVYYVRYVLRRPLADVALSAQLELPERSGWEYGSAMEQSGVNQSLFLRRGDRDVFIQHKMTFKLTKRDMIVDTSASTVVASRPCGPVDRLRCFLFDLGLPRVPLPGGTRP